MADPVKQNRRRRVAMLFVCGLLQLTVFGATLVVAAYGIGPKPWLRVILFGVVLAQCCLLAAFAVFGRWRFPIRCFASATAVVVGGLLLIVADAPTNALETKDCVFITLFSLLMWGIIQTPLWLCRFFLGATAVIGKSAGNNPGGQYGIGQLMGVTLAVALVLGLGRALVPPQILGVLAIFPATDWIFLASLAISAGLIVSATVMTTLNPRYWRLGIGVSAASSLLVAYGLYVILASIGWTLPQDRMAFAILLLCTYAWLQISVLLIRAAGYRIVVRT